MNLWYKLHPNRFPRRQVFKFCFFVRCLYDIDFIYFRIHKHWPTDRNGKIVSLKYIDFCNKTVIYK